MTLMNPFNRHGRAFFLFGEYTNETITGSQNYFEIEFTRRVP